MSLLEWAHLAGFGFASVGCLLACWRARLITHPETRYGLYGLFVTSSIWAGTYLVTFLTSSLALATAAYELGLISGLATIGAWLYFCSAYTGQTYHQQPVYRWLALLTFLGISVVKVTNPVHGRYFAVELVETPFAHASVTLFGAHWAVLLFSYALAAVGFYMLMDLFVDSNVSTTGLGVLVGLTALPVGVDALGLLAVSELVAPNYEPIGVAAFALGTLYVTEDTFEQVRWAGQQQVFDEIDEAILLLDDGGCVYKYNAAAESLLPSVEVAAHIETVVPDTESPGEEDTALEWDGGARQVTLEQGGQRRYYLLRETDLTLGPHQVGRAVVLADVTQVERQRRELERRSDQLEGFGAAVAHELRNSLTIIEGNLTLVAESLETGEIQTATELVERVSSATARMSSVVSDLTTMGQLSQPVADPDCLPFRAVVSEAFATADTDGVRTVVEGQGQIRAGKTRLTELICNAVRLADHTDATTLEARLSADGFVLAMDGDSLSEGDTEALFEYGTAVPHAEAGMLGPNIKTLAQAHGWDVTARTPEDGGVTLTISGVTVE